MPFNEFTRPKYLRNTHALIVAKEAVSKKIMKRHAEKVRKKEKLQITFVVAIVIQMSQSGTDYIL